MTCLNVTTQHLNTKLNVKAQVIDYTSISIKNITQQLQVYINKYTSGLNIECRTICSNKQFTHLIVQPNYVWLNNDILSSTSFDIYSNVVWKID